MTIAADADSLLGALDADQRLAAEATLGPVCMLAGAGTGKTTAITHRIAYGVATGVAARTFHASALSQLGYFWPQVIGGTMPSILDSKGRVIAQAADTLGIKLDTATLRDLAAEIEWRKVSQLTPEQYAAALSKRTIPAGLDEDKLVALHQAYESVKDARRQLDFEDVLLATAGMIESEPWVAQQVREQYRFFVVDEYQDVSPLQQHLLDLWLGERQDLCVVGDASQTIYSFAGASSSFLLGFSGRYPNATVVRLESNYRSTPAIVATANRLMRERPGALVLSAAARFDAGAGLDTRAPASRATRPPEPAEPRSLSLRRPEPVEGSKGAPDSEPQVRSFPTDSAEARAVANRIVEQIDAGVRPQDIAVLYRINVQGAALETALNDAGVSYQLRGGTRFFELPEVKQALMMLKGAVVASVGEPLFKTVSDVLRSLGWTQDAPETRGAVRDRWESLNAIMGLAEASPRETTLRQFVQELQERASAQHEPTMEAVTLATLHSAKGLEWDCVFLVGLSEGLVPITYAKTFEAIDEERRLLYVGITRARKQLHLSWAQTGQGRSSERAPSRFLEELRNRNPGAASSHG